MHWAAVAGELFRFRSKPGELGVVAHACDPNTQETEPGGLTPVQGQPELVNSKLALITRQDPVSKQQKINKGEKSPRRVQFASSGLGEDPPELETQNSYRPTPPSDFWGHGEHAKFKLAGGQGAEFKTAGLLQTVAG